MIDDCKVVSLGCGFGWSGHGSRIVRGFCIVKFESRGDSRLRGNDVDGVGMTLVGAGMTLVGAGMT